MRTLCIGAVLWDIVNGEEYIGGAPFNLACNLHKLNIDSAFLTRVGKDLRGERIKEKMAKFGMDINFVQEDNKNITGIAKVSLDESGNAKYDIPYAAYDEINADDNVISKIKNFNPDVVCFGTMEQRNAISRGSIEKILKNIKPKHVFLM